MSCDRKGAPVNTSLPTISGTPTVNSTLTAGNGIWSGYPAPGFTYQWERCNAAGANCSDLASQTTRRTWSWTPT